MSNYATNYTSPKFWPYAAVNYFGAVPRLGFTENLNDLIEGDRKDYLLGTFLIPGIIWAITLVWFILLAVFMCTCRASFLSGRALYNKEGVMIRTVFLLSISIVLLSSILFLIFGGTPLSDAFEHVEGSKTDLFSFTNEGIDIIRSTRANIEKLTENCRKLNENIATGVCSYLPQDITNLLEGIPSIASSTDYSDQLKQLEDFENGLDDTFSAKNESYVDSILEQVEEIVSRLKYGGLPSMITTFFLCCGAVLSWMGCKKCAYFSFQKYVILPLFACIEIISGVIISLLGVFLIILSDWCTGGDDRSPEGSIEKLLDATLEEEIVRESLDHYIINGCRTPSPFGGLIETKEVLKGISGLVDSTLDKARTYYETVCRDGNSVKQYALLIETNDNLIDLNDEIEKGLRITGCENINSMAVTAMHEGTCGSIPRAMWLMFGFFFAVWFGGLFILATRAACHPSRRHKNLKCDIETRDTYYSDLNSPSSRGSVRLE